jgi:hypothetical protein
MGWGGKAWSHAGTLPANHVCILARVLHITGVAVTGVSLGLLGVGCGGELGESQSLQLRHQVLPLLLGHTQLVVDDLSASGEMGDFRT